MEPGTSEHLTWMTGKFSRSELGMRTQHRATVIVVLSILILSTLPVDNLPTPLDVPTEFHAYQQVDNGNGTWTVEIVDDQTGGFDDGVIRSDRPTEINTTAAVIPLGSDSLMESSGLFGIDFSTIGFWNNASIIEAHLDLTIDSPPSDEVEIFGQLTYRDWVDPSWNMATPAVPWSVPGAGGNTDSGGIMRPVSVTPSSTDISIDVTEGFRIAQAKNAQALGGFLGVMVNGMKVNESGFSDWGFSVHSSESSLEYLRPKWTVLIEWTNPNSLSSNPEWIDLEPRATTLSADSDIGMKAQIRNQDGSMSGAGVEWSVIGAGSIDTSGLYVPYTVGLDFICASWPASQSVAACTPIIVTPGAPASMILMPANTTFTVDNDIQINATFLDYNGNTFPAAPQWSVSSGSIDSDGNWILEDLGTHRVDAASGGLSAWTNVTLVEGGVDNLLMPQNLTVASGERISVLPVAVDRLGNPVPLALAGDISYSMESGTVDNSGMYTGEAVGTWVIDCTATLGATGSTVIEVTVGTPVSLEIVHPSRTVLADEAVPLPVIWTDTYGNAVEQSIPLIAWTADDGGFRTTSNGTVEWLPRDLGNYTVSIAHLGLTHSIEIEVGAGSIATVVIESDEEVLSAGSEVFLQMMAQDSLGNQRVLDADWSIVDGGVAPSPFSTGATYTPSMVGTVNIQANATENGVVYTATRLYNVVPGRLVSVSFQGDGTTMTTDESLDLAPIGLDAMGNPITGLQFNWTVNGVDYTDEIRGSDNVFRPTAVGDVQIQGMADGRAARIDFYVEAGLPQTLEIIPPGSSFTFNGGQEILLIVEGIDQAGNRVPIDGVTWSLLDDAGTMAPGDSPGEYVFTVGKVGTYSLIARRGAAAETVPMTIEPGSPDRIEVITDSDVFNEGNMWDLTIRILDAGGNPVSVDPSAVSVESEIGDGTHVQSDIWRVDIDGYGDDVPVSITFAGLEKVIYVSVQPSALSKLTGTGMGQVAIGSVFVVILLAGLLVLLPRFRSELDEYEDEDENKVQEDETESQPPSLAPSATSFGGYTGQSQSGSMGRSHSRGRHRGAPSADWGQSQMRQASANMAAMGATSSWSPASNAMRGDMTSSSTAMQGAPPPRPQDLDTVSEPDAAKESGDKQRVVQDEQAGVQNPQAAQAAAAASSGVMLACDGTVQGQTGWYHDGRGQMSYWQVDESGAWTRVR